jgi:hypothetical protein
MQKEGVLLHGSQKKFCFSSCKPSIGSLFSAKKCTFAAETAHSMHKYTTFALVYHPQQRILQ